ncbi:hypothetical protein [Oleiagrimonas sp. MCCC 1A03011]|uniref:hypothetical protein n=1 Tax=Oleiagrimonas sp. MCCC 1A03011 TaxID=1926883 RepID=UPI000DC2D7EB|nr:hypothetical protein [Oleiagrimonas sp. MCCC 1A03011]RAP57218.1 hypothetical protein BTJ49_11770 [Oleiagrimonas sp. MCCC 1A03011]
MGPHAPALNALTVVVAAVALGVLLWPTVRRRPAWRATVTPLASIIGSGFLVVGPVLAGVAGSWATAAMIGLCVLAWLFGSAIRFNIVHAEPLRDSETRPHLQALDRLSEVMLAFAYFISVAYYLNLLGAYLLKGFGVVDPTWERVATSVIVLALGVLGYWRGFKAIERVEVFAVSFKLAVIGGLLVALALVLALGDVHGHAPAAEDGTGWHVARVLLGTVILVQGFETSRFLGRHYDATTRVRSMRWAQLLSTGIYVAFIALVLPHVPQRALGLGAETQIVDIVGGVAAVLGPLLVLAAVASQLSAAVADMGGAGGLLHEVTSQRVSPRMAYLGITVAALILTWSVDIFGLIAFASRAFAVYYTMQCLLAFVLAEGRPLRRVLFALGAVLAFAVVVFGIPAG